MAVERLHGMKETAQRQIHKIAALKSRIKTLQKSVRGKGLELAQVIQESTEKYQELEQELDRWKFVYNDLKAELEQLRSENLTQMNEYETKLEESCVRHKAETQEFENQISALIVQLKSAKLMVQKTEESKIVLEREICKLENTIKLSNAAGARRAQEGEVMKRKLAKVAHTARNRIQTERELLQRKFDQGVSVLQEKLTVLEVENKQLKHTATTTENACDRIRKQNDDLSLRLQAAEMRMASLVNDFEREKQLLISQTKTEMLAFENDYQGKLEECRAKIKEAKQNLIGFVTQQFCSLFKVNDLVDEPRFESFLHSVVNRVKELLRLDSNLRELLGLGPRQSIEDAVSTLLLHGQM
jgi:chromosome segregation ATPase